MLNRFPVNIPHKMLSRLLASHILLVTIPLLITAVVLTSTAQDSIEKTILNRNLELVKGSARQVELTIQNVHDILRLSAESPAINQMNRMDLRYTINQIVYEFEIFKRINVLNREGRLVATTAFSAVDAPGDEFLSRSELERISTHRQYSSEVYLSAENLPVMDVFEQIVRHNEVMGFLWAEVDLKAIWSLVDSNAVGKHGEALIFRKDGQLIAHTDRVRVLRGEYFQEEQILADVANGIADSKVYTTRDGVKMIVAYAPILIKNWGAVIQQPTSEAFAPAKKMRLQILVLMVLSIVVAALIAFFYTRKILQPVDRLVRGINRIASGDLHHRVEPVGKDEISQLAEHFNQMTARLRNMQNKLKRTERLETLGKLASVLSHEIRNPLNSMVINMQILRREYRHKPPDSKKLEHYHRIVTGEIKRVDELVGNFLMIAKPPKLDRKVIRLAEILDELIQAQQPLTLPKGVRIQRRYEDESLLSRVDRNKLKQVFLNIMINAVQAMPGGGTLVIEMEKTLLQEADFPHDMIRIAFRDTGKGIKPEELKHIFDFYFSTKPDGTGIGLSIAQQIIEELGGQIKIYSDVGKGTEVLVYLPLYRGKN